MKLKKKIQRVIIALSVIALGTSGMPNIAYGAVAATSNHKVVRTVAKRVVTPVFSTRIVNKTKVNKDFVFTGKISGLKAPQAIKVYIDKALVTSIKTDAAGNFTYVVPITNYKFAYHTIKFDAKLKTGRTISLTRTVNYTPYMVYGINDIQTNAVYTEKLSLSGWALNYKGIKSVSIFVDNMKTPVGNAQLGLPSEEAGKMYANYPSLANSANSGFSYELMIDTAKYKVGKHNVKVNILGKDGTLKTKTYSVAFAERKPYFAVESLKNNFVSKNTDIAVKGWFIAPDGAEKVRVMLDGVEQPDIAFGLDRADIGGKYIDYLTSGKSGFEMTLPINKIKAGKHALKVDFLVTDAALAADIVVGTQDLNFTVVKPAAKLTIDKPVFSNTALGKSLILTGYGVHPSGVTSIQVLVDGQLQPIVAMGMPNDVATAKYPTYPGSSLAGYVATIDASNWNLAKHDVSVIMTGVDGDVVTAVKDMNLDGITYALMDKTLSYYVDKEYNRGRNTSYYSSGTKAPKTEISTYLNPINYVSDPQYKYVFMKLNYFDGITAEMLDKALVGKGVLEGKGKVFLAAGKANNVNPIYLVSHALLETGNGTSSLSEGIEVTEIMLTTKDPLGEYNLVPVTKPLTVYNMFGIGAYNGDPNSFGSSMAFTGGQSLTTYSAEEQVEVLNGKYAWTSIDKAIIGGAKFIGMNYANDNRYTESVMVKNNVTYKGNAKYQQNTIFKMKWDFFSMENEAFYVHQYATDVGWARKQTARIKALLDIMGNPQVQYEVPIYVEE